MSSFHRQFNSIWMPFIFHENISLPNSIASAFVGLKFFVVFLKVSLPKFRMCASNIAFVAWLWRYVVLAFGTYKAKCFYLEYTRLMNPHGCSLVQCACKRRITFAVSNVCILAQMKLLLENWIEKHGNEQVKANTRAPTKFISFAFEWWHFVFNSHLWKRMKQQIKVGRKAAKVKTMAKSLPLRNWCLK